MSFSRMWRILGVFIAALLICFSFLGVSAEKQPTKEEAGAFVQEIFESILYKQDVGPLLDALSTGQGVSGADQMPSGVSKEDMAWLGQAIAGLAESHGGVKSIRVVEVQQMGSLFFVTMEITFNDNTLDTSVQKVTWLDKQQAFMFFQ